MSTAVEFTQMPPHPLETPVVWHRAYCLKVLGPACLAMLVEMREGQIAVVPVEVLVSPGTDLATSEQFLRELCPAHTPAAVRFTLNGPAYVRVYRPHPPGTLWATRARVPADCHAWPGVTPRPDFFSVSVALLTR